MIAIHRSTYFAIAFVTICGIASVFGVDNQPKSETGQPELGIKDSTGNLHGEECQCNKPKGELGAAQCTDGIKYLCSVNHKNKKCRWEKTIEKCDDENEN